MTSDRRAFLEKYAHRWTTKAIARRASGAPVDLAVAGALERIVGEMQAQLAASPPTAIAAVPSDEITWKAPVFNVGGRFNPFAGTKREGWLASAAACERMGYHDVARGYRQMAADVDPDEMPVWGRHRSEAVDDAPQVSDRVTPSTLPARRKKGSRSFWSGPPIPPPEPVAFAAGPQMDMFV